MHLLSVISSRASGCHFRSYISSHHRLTARQYPRCGVHTFVRPRRPSTTKMAKKKNNTPAEEALFLPLHPARRDTPEAHRTPIVDTHTHLLSTFSSYQSTYKPGKHETIWDFVRAMYQGQHVQAIVDVWCEAPVRKTQWKEIADSALSDELIEKKWGGLQYWFVMGTSILGGHEFQDGVNSLPVGYPRSSSVSILATALELYVHNELYSILRHEAKLYTDDVEQDMYVDRLCSFNSSLHILIL